VTNSSDSAASDGAAADEPTAAEEFDRTRRGPEPGTSGLLPLFPLSTVLVPGLVMPLHIFEPRYRRLVADLQNQPEGSRRFGIVAIRDGVDIGAAGAKALHRVGTTAEVQEITMLPDGRSALTVVGGTRFELTSVDRSGAPYLLGHVDYLPELNGADAQSLVPRVIKQYRLYRAAISAWTADDDSPRQLSTDPELLSYIIASTTVLDLSERQALLEQVSTAGRLRAALHLLRRETILTDVLQSLPSSDFARIDVSHN
jgi:Lon protease-like protein